MTIIASRVLEIHGFKVAVVVPVHYSQFAHGRSHTCKYMSCFVCPCGMDSVILLTS